MSPSPPSLEEARARGVDVDERSVFIPADGAHLSGDLALPRSPRGLVVFAHGSGSSRHSPRNRFVARELQKGRLGTLLLDLLTPDEEAVDVRTAELRFDIGLLARRLVAAVEWARMEPATRDLRIGVFGASTGGGAALVAAALRPEAITAVVSRGGRPDLAGDALPAVRTPTLLIVGGDDEPVIELNRQAMDRMRTEVELEVVPGATHLFEEPGTLEEVARLARDLFVQRLGVRSF
ncbi:MAG: dienelactone hydrolase family protein [Myxococcota bacterium]|nr:dienelactone hydrolase family protein [Myxococcota bacterium]